MTPPNQPSNFIINLEDEVVRGALVVHHGALLQPPPRPAPPAPAVQPTPTKAVEAEKEARAITPWQKATREVATVTAGMGTVVALGKATGTMFMTNFFTFGLAGLIGYRVVWGVAPALHSPLMSVTNAISGKSIGSKCMRVMLTALRQVWLVLVGSSSWVVATFLERHRKSLVLYQSFWPVSTLLEVSSSPNACWICLRVIVF